MTTLEAVVKLKEEYRELLDKDTQNFVKQIENVTWQQSLNKDELTREENLGRENILTELERENTVLETDYLLQKRVNFLAPQLAKLLNELDTNKIDREYFIEYEPSKQKLFFSDRSPPQQYFEAFWDDECLHYQCQDGNLDEEQTLEIFNTVNHNLEAIRQAKKIQELEKIKQQELEL